MESISHLENTQYLYNMLDLALDDRIFLDDPIDCAVQELDLIFNTNCTELIGYTEYGTTFEHFLWEMTPSVEEVKNYITVKLYDTYFLRKYMIDINVKILSGNIRDIYYITINIKNPNQKGNKSSQRQRIYQYQ